MVSITYECSQGYDLFIAGDVCPIDGSITFAPQIDFKLLDIMSRARVRIVNLECPITTQTAPIAKTGPALKAASYVESLLSDLNVDICNLANNHIMDYGSQGAEDTVFSLEQAGISNLGIMKNNSLKPYILDINGKRIAFVSFTENEFSTLSDRNWMANPMDHYVQWQQINEARKAADYVVVQYHGGAEMYSYPTPGQKDYAHYLADIGASIVICHHSHCISGYEIYNGVPIFYGLGNFYFPGMGSTEHWFKGLGLCINFGQEIKIDLTPIRYDNNTHVLVTSQELKHQIQNEVEKLNEAISSDEQLQRLWCDFCQKTAGGTLNAFFSPTLVSRALIKLGLKKTLSHRANWKLINILRCETHREKLLTTLRYLVDPRDD